MKIPIEKLVRISSTVGPGQEGYFEDYYEKKIEYVEVKEAQDDTNAVRKWPLFLEATC